MENWMSGRVGEQTRHSEGLGDVKVRSEDVEDEDGLDPTLQWQTLIEILQVRTPSSQTCGGSGNRARGRASQSEGLNDGKSLNEELGDEDVLDLVMRWEEQPSAGRARHRKGLGDEHVHEADVGDGDVLDSGLRCQTLTTTLETKIHSRQR